MSFSENEFTLQEYVAPTVEEVPSEAMPFEEEWKQFQEREDRARQHGQAALFDVVLVDGEVKVKLEEN